MFEIHDGGPVVGFVFFEPTCCAGGSSCEIFIRLHCQIESRRFIRLSPFEGSINISRILEVTQVDNKILLRATSIGAGHEHTPPMI